MQIKHNKNQISEKLIFFSLRPTQIFNYIMKRVGSQLNEFLSIRKSFQSNAQKLSEYNKVKLVQPINSAIKFSAIALSSTKYILYANEFDGIEFLHGCCERQSSKLGILLASDDVKRSLVWKINFTLGCVLQRVQHGW